VTWQFIKKDTGTQRHDPRIYENKKSEYIYTYIIRLSLHIKGTMAITDMLKFNLLYIFVALQKE